MVVITSYSIHYTKLYEYSPHLKLYWCKGRVYDELSAMHNGIIGPGAQLRRIIAEDRQC